MVEKKKTAIRNRGLNNFGVHMDMQDSVAVTQQRQAYVFFNSECCSINAVSDQVWS